MRRLRLLMTATSSAQQVILPMQDIESEITVVTYNTALADNHQVERIFELLNRAEIEFSLKDQIYAIARRRIKK